MLRKAYHYFLKGRPRRNVGPIPLGSIEQKVLDCADVNSASFENLLTQMLPARGPADATTKEEIDKEAAQTCGLSASETPIYLQGRWFSKVRRSRAHQNMYFYRYCFADSHGVKGKPQFIKILPTHEK